MHYHPLQIPYKVVARREGDVAACYANPSLAHEELGWTAALGLDRMCECLRIQEWAELAIRATGWAVLRQALTIHVCTGEDLWRWQKQNPSGFGAQA